MAGVRSTKEYNGNSSGAEEANPPIPRPQSPVPRHSLPRGITASVEPPRVSGYTFNKTPSPLSTIGLHVPRPRSTKIGSFPLAEIESRAEGSHRDAQIQNKSASAFLPQTGLGGKLKAKLLPGKTPEKAQNEIPSPTDIIQGNVPPWARIAPRVPVMNPESFHLKSRDGPKPPDEIVFHAELQRHGGTYNPNPGYTKQASPSGQQNNEDEASYQVDVTPPVIQQAPPRSIFMDPSLTLVGDEHAHATSAGHMANHADDSTWVLPSSSNTNALVPPVLNDPMRSPGTNLISLEGDAGLSAPGLSIPANSIAATHYDIDRPTCSLNLVCYRSGAKGCYLQQIQCVLRSRFAKEGDFRLVVLQNPHLVYDDAEFFKEMRRLFEIEMCGFLQRYFSLKSLKAFRVLVVSSVSYEQTQPPLPLPIHRPCWNKAYLR